MNQQKLEEKVRRLFEEQGFKIEKEGNCLTAQNGEELSLKVFSSEKYTKEEVEASISGNEKIFVDKGLGKVREKLENDISVIKQNQRNKDHNLPSYEIIGEIAVINELTVDEEEAVEGILEHHPSVKTILLKEKPLQGEYRVGEYRKLYGEETETVHKEYGCKFKVDPTKVYYSERFSTERKRVVDQVEDGEKVLVMFAGVGPFAIMAAKLANPEKVVAVEKNPVAAEYLEKNTELNGVDNVVEGYEGDVREVLPGMAEKFDRIIMPLPKDSKSFLDVAEMSLLERGVIHLYLLNRSGNEDFEHISEGLSSADFRLFQKVECGNYSPDEDRVCLDIMLD
jgi:tRNA (guanine37-N1)-methyltransferase